MYVTQFSIYSEIWREVIIMFRTAVYELEKWKNKRRRKPLLVRGARQVGKTWLLKEFGKTFEGGLAYFNFDRQHELNQFFESTKEPGRILSNLSMATGQKITKDTLIVFDEIQECGEALNSLKYFCEEAPDYYVASAGSLLGLQLSNGFPVGKVEFLDMGPMTFSEFLLATGHSSLYEYINSIDNISSIPEALFNPLTEELKKYFVVGGMPEAVRIWSEEGDAAEVEDTLQGILDSYESDFGKHAPADIVPRIHLIWASLPSQLTRENKKFLYSVVKPGARAREYEDALEWLIDADLAGKIYRVTKPGIPQSAYDDLSAFKIYMPDVGLLRRHSRLAPSAFAEENRLFTEFKGALTENYVFQSLTRLHDVIPRYWSDTPNYEVDFIIQLDNRIIPIEVKAGINVRAANIKKYASLYPDETPLIVRTSLKNLSLDGNVLNIPLFLADRIPALTAMSGLL